MSEETDRLAEMINDPVARYKFLQSLRENKPTHWAATSRSPYYNLKVGKQMQTAFDSIMSSSSKKFVWFYKDNQNLSHHTLYTKIYQGIKFLLDHLDPDKKYKAFYDCCGLRKVYGLGVQLEVKSILLTSSSQEFQPQSSDFDAINWKNDMEDFVQNGKGVFHKKGLAITDEEIETILTRFSQCSDIMAYATNKEIKLIKT